MEENTEKRVDLTDVYKRQTLGMLKPLLFRNVRRVFLIMIVGVLLVLLDVYKRQLQRLIFRFADNRNGALLPAGCKYHKEQDGNLSLIHISTATPSNLKNYTRGVISGRKN